MLVPNRHESSKDYRYGFNGKEKDDEFNGDVNSYDYGARMYNPRVGRFLSLDPLSHDFPFYSPFQFAGNSPIFAIDLDGLEMQISNTVFTLKEGKGTPELNYSTDIKIHYKVLNLTGRKIEGIQQITDFARDRSRLVYSDRAGMGNFSITFDGKGNRLKQPISYKLNGKIKSFETTFSVIKSTKEINDSDYVVILVNQRLSNKKYPEHAHANLAGNIMTVDIGNPDYKSILTNGTFNFNLMTTVARKIGATINHETGHNLGLDDEYKMKEDGQAIVNPGYENNQMSGGSGKELNSRQIASILNDIFTNFRIDLYNKKKSGKEQTDSTKSQVNEEQKKLNLGN